MRAILTTVGKDKIGIIAQVSKTLADEKINILDVSQTLMADNFVMTMMVNVPEDEDLVKLNDCLNKLGQKLNVEINLRNEELFSAMHGL
ncbi:ACT domain-containing protein [Lactobacillus ultunensis]|uniref:UPF0237 protein HMPREF0548_1169 n=1 Tax=Lactobacillus ultunensis DSM 16047 TaxID=525365 RepID=C2ENC3_9LACO|nr:ACT domain-containing protein [Lactobacillus ultunensis]EEJ71927.1 ACT domain protein [Lactobacillus ultunensis DSM 16047]KRL82076.1 ACT domain protein [Lactobacillus ultunensis DSM 16047]QQP27659.1 ACT domain-containing protein [Lactobacillus ultunensis]